jgi:4-amino-4-deoxy-L-arabinose transferase-like glycosyltransferase
MSKEVAARRFGFGVSSVKRYVKMVQQGGSLTSAKAPGGESELGQRKSFKSWLPGTKSPPFGWADLVVIPLIIVLSVPPLMWFGHHWTVIGNDAARYLLAGSELVSGQGLENLNGTSEFNGAHGPGFPALIGSLILLFGRDTEDLVWAVRLMALVNALFAYFLTKRISSPTAGLIAAALVTLFGYDVMTPDALNIDAPLLTLYLLMLLALLAAIKRDSSLLALLSGLLLGASILTKETALTNLPLALLAVLMLGWDLRRALWHYLGVVLVCLPWWVWAWSASGEVYLVNRLPVQFQVPVLVATVICLGVAAAAYASGMVAHFMADERRRRWTGWFVVVLWTISLTGLLLATATHALTELSLEALRQHLAYLLAPSIVVVPTLLAVVGYVVWKARWDRPWRLLALTLLFQVPVCLLVTVEEWAPRQYLIPQTLLFCALAALVVDAGEVALRGYGHSGRLIGALVAVPVVILLVAASVERIQALLPENPAGGLPERHTVALQDTEMIDWIAQNIPEGEHILVVAEPAINEAQANYLMFLDDQRHEWTQLQLDQGICVPRPNIQMRCDPDENAISRTPPDAVWVQSIQVIPTLQVTGGCKVISLSMSNLLEQASQSRADYVMVSGSYIFPGILQLPSPLQQSNAFEIIHAEFGQEGESGAHEGVVLLKSTGRAPKAVPTHMDGYTVRSLKRCEQAEGPEDAQRIRSTFPNGIMVRNGILGVTH